jgi:hypothetical protein
MLGNGICFKLTDIKSMRFYCTNITYFGMCTQSVSDNTTTKNWCLWIIWSFPSCDQQMTQFAMIVLLSAISAGKPRPSCVTSARSSPRVQVLVTLQPILWTNIINSAIMMMDKIQHRILYLCNRVKWEAAMIPLSSAVPHLSHARTWSQGSPNLLDDHQW